MQGGDCGSSICRGGLPTQRFSVGGAVVGGSGDPSGPRATVVVEPPRPTPSPAPGAQGAPGGQSPSPVPAPNSLACSFGCSLICSAACGENSAIAGGGGCRVVSVTAA